MNPWKAYKKVKMETATPQEAVILAYRGIVRYLEGAKEDMKRGDYPSCGEKIFRARRLLSELTLGLNDEAGELADNFRALYNFCYRRTIEANLRRDPAILEEVISLLEPLVSAWEEGLKALKQESEPAVQGSLEEQIA